MKQMYNFGSNEKSFLTTRDVKSNNGRVTAENCSSNVYQQTTVARTVTVLGNSLEFSKIFKHYNRTST